MKNNFYVLLSITTGLILIILYFLSGENGLFTRNIVMMGSLILSLITVLSYFVSVKSISSENPHRFVRGVMAATMIKFMLCILAVAVLLFMTNKKLHKPDLFLLMFVYIAFSAIESFTLSAVSKKK